MRTAISGRLASNRSEPSAKLGLIFFRHTEWPNLNFVELTFKFLARSHLISGGGGKSEFGPPKKIKIYAFGKFKCELTLFKNAKD